MSKSARELLEEVRKELAPRDDDNRLVPLIAKGQAPRSVFAAIVGEESRIVPSDWRSFLTLAARADEFAARELFGGLGQGEGIALRGLDALAAETGMDDEALRRYRPKAGCQAYPAYLCWLALNGEPADVIVAVTANFAAWGRYCAEIAQAMRTHYGFSEEACAFFDFFATPAPEVEEQAIDAVAAAMDAGTLTDDCRRYAELFQSYELMFWNTLAEIKE